MLTEETFENYDRITDTLMYLSNRITLDFVVTLGWKAKDGSRRFFHSEYEKTSNFIGTETSVTIRRLVKYFFKIDEKDNKIGGILLYPSDVAILTKILETQVLPWFQGETRVFDVIDKRLAVTGKFTPVVFSQSVYKYLSFVPVVFEYQSGQFKEAVHVCMNTQDVSWNMMVDDVFGLYYLLTNTSMYNLAASMMNYVKIPPYGVNKTHLAGLGAGNKFQQEFTNTNNSSKGTNSFLDNLKGR